MIHINEETVKQMLSVDFVMPVVIDAHLAAFKKEMYVADRSFVKLDGEKSVGQWLFANCTHKPYFGAKFSSVFPSNLEKGLPSVISKINLYSSENGDLVAVIDADYLTAIKTGCNAAVATDLMATPNASKLGIIGTGLQAFSQVLAIAKVRELKEVHIFDLSKQRIETFSEQIKDILPVDCKIIASTSGDECAANSDIICTCTTSPKPVFDGNVLKPGTHINAVGSFTAFMQEIDTNTVVKSAKVITEHLEGFWETAGDLVIPLNESRITQKKLTGTIGAALSHEFSTRDDEGQITLHESIGSGVLDIALAIAIYEQHISH